MDDELILLPGEERSITRSKLEEKIRSIWVELGRESNKLKLDNKEVPILVDSYNKLRAIKFSFALLFKQEANHTLAISVLANAFINDKDTQDEGEGPK